MLVFPSNDDVVQNDFRGAVLNGDEACGELSFTRFNA